MNNNSRSKAGRKPNRLLQVMIILSLGVHALIFMHIAGIYRTGEHRRIEFTMQDTSEPFRRAIPRPRKRLKAPEINNVQKVKIPSPAPPQIDIDASVDEAPSPVTEAVSMPDVSGVRPAEAASFDATAAPVFASKADYFEMVRMKIEGRKTYPEAARMRHMQGRIQVAFTIEKNGGVSAVEVIKGSRHQILNRAALEAVESSAPFPAPPGSLFKNREKLNLTLTISFELT